MKPSTVESQKMRRAYIKGALYHLELNYEVIVRLYSALFWKKADKDFGSGGCKTTRRVLLGYLVVRLVWFGLIQLRCNAFYFVRFWRIKSLSS